MLYRRHLRIKVLQALYAWYTTESDDLIKGEKQLLLSINKLYELYIWQLSFLVEIKRYAETRLEERKDKFYPTKEDLDPNLKFINNKVNALLENNKDFLHKEQLYKVNWSDQQIIVKKFYDDLEKSDIFKKFMSSNKSGIDEDKMFYIKLVDQSLSEMVLLKDFYEEKSVFFVDGYDLVQLLLIKFFEIIDKNFTSDRKMRGLFKGHNQSKNEDLDFVNTLYKKTILRNEENEEILKAKTKNWDFDRIPLMDVILLKMAIVELQEMETVPVKVTLNEYIELTKYFSTSKSRTFVNGVLDRLIREFKEDGRIKKVGRGLIE